MESDVPLCVDLDGTVIHTDMLHESTLRLLRDRPLDVCRLPFWLMQGKAVLKRNIAGHVDIEVSTLPYNEILLDWLKAQRQVGRRLILCTASDEKFAAAVGAHLGIFDEILSSNGSLNLAGARKAEVLVERFGSRGFDYAGNSSADLKVWRHARRAVVVNGKRSLTRQAAAECPVELEFPASGSTLSRWPKMLRVHQWLKNALLFVPLLAAHRLGDVDAVRALFLAFLSFSLCASAVYIGNDLVDLESDRLHPRKRRRPFAAGTIPAWVGVALVPVLLGASSALALAAGMAFLKGLLVYFVITCAYSLWLKRLVLVDCLTLAVLYTLRIIAGAAAAGLGLSFWLLAFSVFLFLSLAFVKRVAELQIQILQGKEKAHGRGYVASDVELLSSLGVTAGYASVLVLALYLNSEAVLRLYPQPEWVWGAVLVMLFWVSWVWMCAHRGEMHDDPLVFAVKDKVSLMAGAAFTAVVMLGSIKWP